MRRLLSCLGVVGLLAAAGLAHPAVASAQGTVIPDCQRTPGGGPFDFFIAEAPPFETANPEQFLCLTAGLTTTFTATVDLTEFTPQNPTPPIPATPDSDSVFFGTDQSGFSTAHLVSDTEPFGIAGSSTIIRPETEMSCAPGGLPDPAGDPEGTCNGAVITGIPFFNPVTGVTNTGTLTVISDVVPEPSTGLLLGTVLPVLLGIRRRSIRVSA